MKNYIYQFYNEGLATTFYLKPINFIKKRVKNKKIIKVISMMMMVFYTILVIGFAVIVFLDKYPF